jgi:protein-disulfide isomerase
MSITACRYRLYFLGLVFVALIAATASAGAESGASELDQALQQVVGDYLTRHPEAIERVVQNYLVKHPEVLQATLVELLKKRRSTVPDSIAAKADVVHANAAALFQSKHQVTLGNPEGHVTLVEFFDYSCGFCKRALGDLTALMKADPDLKIVLKEFPILGTGSLEAARVAAAAHLQDQGGDKYLAFHRSMLSRSGPATRSAALDAARDAGFDVERIERDMSSEDVLAALAENARLGKELGLTGTPSYVIGDAVIIGAVGLATLDERIKSAPR